MNRSGRAVTAKETLEIMERGEYQSPSGRVVRIADQLAAALKGTRLYRPGDFPDALSECEGRRETTDVHVEVPPETSLQAARRLAADGQDVLCLNFASAKNPVAVTGSALGFS